jgi:predicted DNA-binding WGR domain protein
MKAYFEGLHNQEPCFCDINQRGNEVLVHFGTIGTAGQKIIRHLRSVEEARCEANRLAVQYISRGYERKNAKSQSPAKGVCSVVKPSRKLAQGALPESPAH